MKKRTRDPRMKLELVGRAVIAHGQRLSDHDVMFDELYGRLREAMKRPWPFGWLYLRKIEKVVAAQLAARQAAQAAEQYEEQSNPDLVLPDKTIVGPDGEAV
jgi:hypothetical protein